MEPEVVHTLDTEAGPVAHIVKTEPGESAAAKILAARVNGTPIEALCGHIWIPDRNPDGLPVCPPCDEIYQLEKMWNADLSENPTA